MPNITLSIDEQLLRKSRKYAETHNNSLNALIRKLLTQTVEKSSKSWLDDSFKLADKIKATSKGKRWKREDLYDL